MGTRRNVYGEGNYEATRQYNESTKEFIDSGRVERAVRDAAPKTPIEAAEMTQAEKAGLERAKAPLGKKDGARTFAHEPEKRRKTR